MGEVALLDRQRELQVDRQQLLNLAIRCFSRALALQPDSAGMWHEVNGE